MSTVTPIAAAARQRAEARAAQAKALIRIAAEGIANYKDLDALARARLEAAETELRALDAADAASTA